MIYSDRVLFGVLLLCVFVVGCSDDGSVPWENECDPGRRPVVFVHGFMETGDAFANQSMRFASNGYCLDSVRAFDWNTVGDFGGELLALGTYIEAVLTDTGADQIDLVGHSMGTGLSAAYLATPENAAGWPTT